MIKNKSAKNWQIYCSAFWYRLMRVQGQHTGLDAGSGNLSTQNAQLSAGTLSARTAGHFSNNGGTINADTLQISAQSLSNRKGSLIQT